MTEKVRWSRRHELGHERADGELVIVPAAPIRVCEKYRPDSNFLYLTGISKPNAVLVLFRGEEILFCGDGCSAYPEIEIEEVQPIENLEKAVLPFLAACETVYFPITQYAEWDSRILGWIKKILKAREFEYLETPDIKDVRKPLNVMRIRKEPIEIEALRSAALIACEAHKKSSRTVLDKPVTTNTIKENEMVCVRTQREFGGYLSEVTRTLPVGGTYAPVPRALYDIVLSAQCHAIESARAGLTLSDVHRANVRGLAEGLLRLGILTNQSEIDYAVLTHCGPKMLDTNPLKRFFPYATSHWIGLNLHDPSDYINGIQSRMLEAGMTIVVESSLRIPQEQEAEDIDPRWRGVRIHIGDVVLVTGNGPEVLTQSAPKDPDEIEKLMREK